VREANADARRQVRGWKDLRNEVGHLTKKLGIVGHGGSEVAATVGGGAAADAKKGTSQT
jgi:hypothetical protein